MSFPENHHYNPQFYLRNWSKKDGLVPYFTRRNGKVVKSFVSPKKTGFVKGLYSFKNVPKEQQEVLETNFFTPEVDTKAAPILKKLLENGISSLERKERILWTRFLISARVRVPDVVNQLKADGIAEIQRQTTGDDPENDWIIPENIGLTVLPRLITDPEHTKIIAEMAWWIEDFSGANVSLLTSDRPIWASTGLKKPRCLVAFPLSPKKLFCASNTQDYFRAMESLSPNEVVRRSNRTIASQAKEFVYGEAEVSFIEGRLRPFDNPT